MIGLLGLVAQLSVVARAPQSAGVCEPITVTVAARSWGGAMPTIATPSVAPFELLRASLSPRLTIDSAGAGSVLAEFSYVLAISQAGTFDVPSFTVRAGRLTGRSQPVRIVVAGAREGAPGVMVRAQVDTGTGVNTRPIAEPETVFVGQQANYQVVVFLGPRDPEPAETQSDLLSAGHPVHARVRLTVQREARRSLEGRAASERSRMNARSSRSLPVGWPFRRRSSCIRCRSRAASSAGRRAISSPPTARPSWRSRSRLPDGRRIMQAPSATSISPHDSIPPSLGSVIRSC